MLQIQPTCEHGSTQRIVGIVDPTLPRYGTDLRPTMNCDARRPFELRPGRDYDLVRRCNISARRIVLSHSVDSSKFHNADSTAWQNAQPARRSRRISSSIEKIESLGSRIVIVSASDASAGN